jgi:2-methylcitrate dehydratase PrpD
MTLPKGIADAVIASGNVPDSVLDAARLHLLDAFGVALAGAARGPVRRFAGAAAELGGCGPATVVGETQNAPAPIAALVNGTLIHSLEFDDTHISSITHGSSVLAPAALATAEATHADGPQMLRGFALGWEILIRLGLASPGTLQACGFQVTSTLGPFASAVTAASIREDSAEVMANALAIAGSVPAGNFSFVASAGTVKAFQPGWAAHGGLIAEAAARSGMTGGPEVFDGPFGFYRIYARDEAAGTRLDALFSDFGDRWYLPEAAFKLYPCCHYIHPFIEALIAILDGGVQEADIAQIHCRVPSEEIPIIVHPWSERQRPRSTHAARWSLPYVLAVQLAHGRVDVEHFDGEPDESVIARAQSCSFEPWDGSGFPARYPAEITVTLSDGSTVRAAVDDVSGAPGREIDADGIVEKFVRNACLSGLSRPMTDELLGHFLDPDGPDVEAITKALAQPIGLAL